MFSITRKNQRGFTLIELLAVMAIVAVLAGIVSVAVGGTSETSKDTQTKQDATTMETAAADYFSDQVGAEVLTTKTVNVQIFTGIQQKISSRWPEIYITDVYESAFGDVTIRDLTILTADQESTISIPELLENSMPSISPPCLTEIIWPSNPMAPCKKPPVGTSTICGCSRRPRQREAAATEPQGKWLYSSYWRSKKSKMKVWWT